MIRGYIVLIRLSVILHSVSNNSAVTENENEKYSVFRQFSLKHYLRTFKPNEHLYICYNSDRQSGA
jgi:hypothetical protein